MGRKRARSLDGCDPPLLAQIIDLQKAEQLHHSERMAYLKLLCEHFGSDIDLSNEKLRKRTKLSSNDDRLVLSRSIDEPRSTYTPRASSDTGFQFEPSVDRNPQFSNVMKSFAASIIQSLIREASRKTALSEQ